MLSRIRAYRRRNKAKRWIVVVHGCAPTTREVEVGGVETSLEADRLARKHIRLTEPAMRGLYVRNEPHQIKAR